MAVLRGVLWLLFGAAGMWLGMWALLILNSYVSLALVIVILFVAGALIEERRQERSRRESEDPVRNVETFLRVERVARLLEEVRERRARERMKELPGDRSQL